MLFLYQKMTQATHHHAGDSAFHPDWADDYTTTMWIIGVRGEVGLYRARHADAIPIPTKAADPPAFRSGRVVAPDRDIDDPLYMPIERFIPRFLWQAYFVPIFTCAMGTIRNF